MNQPVNILDYIKLLSSSIPFSQANFGDGEWSCILGKKGKNAQGGIYYPELGKALGGMFETPILSAYGFNSGKKLKEEVNAWLYFNRIRIPKVKEIPKKYDWDLEYVDKEGCIKIPWVYKEILAAVNCYGDLGPFIHFLRQKKVLLVGGPHLKNLDIFNFDYIETPAVNAWDSFGEVLHNTANAIQQYLPEITLVSCGMAGKVLIYALVKEKIPFHIIDTGAIFDPWVGVQSRKAYLKPIMKERMTMSLATANEMEISSNG